MHFQKFLPAIFLTLVLAACSTTANLYPISGPLSEQRPLPVLSVEINGISGNSGTLSTTLPDGETLSGKWSSIAPMSYGMTTGVASGSATDGMNSVWATVYGAGFSAANVPGVNKGEAMLIGDRGTVMHVEFLTGSGTANGTGVAKDNKGNIYKVLF
jgi:hypothetical protein